MKNKQRKKIAGMTLAAVAFAVMFAAFASADSYQLWCLGDDEEVDFGDLCNPAMGTVEGTANICVHLLDNGKSCPAAPNVCNSLGLSCSNAGGNSSVDQEPPTIEVSSPDNEAVYRQRALLLSLVVDEKSDVHYRFNTDSGPQNNWRQVCLDCYSYSGTRSFEEGLNDITFRATDEDGNEGFQNIQFFVDTQVPRIRSTSPASGFASGDFSVEFEEGNPIEVKINYGNSEVGMREQLLDLESCVQGTNRRYTCSVFVDLADYDNQQVQYSFSVKDIADNFVTSIPKSVDVDNSAPIVNNFEYDVSGKYLSLMFDVSETNFKEIVFVEDGSSRETRVCSRLVDNVCEKRVSFRDGSHILTIYIRDEAGNFVFEEIEFFTDSKVPKISKTEPKRGFASGMFYVKLQEENLESVVLNYGNEETGFRQKSLDVEEDCSPDRNFYQCMTDVDLDDYDGEEISYSFTVTDVVSQSKSSRNIYLTVDATLPVLNSVEHTLVGSTATLALDITEDNFDKVVYSNNGARERNLCTRLSAGICTGRIRLVTGVNSIDFQILDDAGNSIAQNFEIVL